MSDNKIFGFDILENSDMNTIEEIGTDKMDIDKKDMERILKNTMKKYEKEKQKPDMTDDTFSENDEGSDPVSGVEIYNRKKLPHIIFVALCSAAAVVLTIGSIAVLNHRNVMVPNNNDPIVEVTTSVTRTSALITAKTTSSGTPVTTVKETEKATETTTQTTASSSDDTTTVTTSSEQNYSGQSDIFVHNNPKTERTDITQEELDSARMEIMDKLMNTQTALWNIRYAYFDLNNDTIPELFLGYNFLGEGNVNMYVYDGKEYVKSEFTSRFEAYGRKEYIVCGSSIYICPEENLIHASDLLSSGTSQILEFDKNNTIKTIHEYQGDGVFNGEKIVNMGRPDFLTEEMKEFNSALALHNWQEPEFIVYAEKNESAVRFEKEVYNINDDKS